MTRTFDSWSAGSLVGRKLCLKVRNRSDNPESAGAAPWVFKSVNERRATDVASILAFSQRCM